MQENNEPPTEGKAANRKREEEFLGNIVEFHGATLHAVGVGDDVTFSEGTYDMTLKNGPRMRLNEIARRRWENGKIVHEGSITAGRRAVPGPRARDDGRPSGREPPESAADEPGGARTEPICRPRASGSIMWLVFDGVCRSELMPTYRYICQDCGKTFERTETFSEHEEAKPPCPKCGSKNLSTVPRSVYVETSRKS
jgi:putative FmdB family regulatory protein